MPSMKEIFIPFTFTYGTERKYLAYQLQQSNIQSNYMYRKWQTVSVKQNDMM